MLASSTGVCSDSIPRLSYLSPLPIHIENRGSVYKFVAQTLFFRHLERNVPSVRRMGSSRLDCRCGKNNEIHPNWMKVESSCLETFVKGTDGCEHSLLYVFRWDSPRHAECRRWLEALVNAQAAYGIAPQLLASVIRISTHTRIYRPRLESRSTRGDSGMDQARSNLAGGRRVSLRFCASRRQASLTVDCAEGPGRGRSRRSWLTDAFGRGRADR